MRLAVRLERPVAKHCLLWMNVRSTRGLRTFASDRAGLPGQCLLAPDLQRQFRSGRTRFRLAPAHKLTEAFSGKAPSFFNRSIASRAAFRASSRFAALSFSENGICAYLTVGGGSKRPSWKRALRRRLRLTSACFSPINPVLIAVV